MSSAARRAHFFAFAQSAALREKSTRVVHCVVGLRQSTDGVRRAEMADEQAMSKRIGVIADAFENNMYFGNSSAGDAHVMVDIDQLRREYPHQARTDVLKQLQMDFRRCMKKSWSSYGRKTCRVDLIGALEYLRM
jgi:hypothetical protein